MIKWIRTSRLTIKNSLSPGLQEYLAALFNDDILPSLVREGVSQDDAVRYAELYTLNPEP